MQFDLVTPERLIMSGDATHVIATGSEGSMGVLENHQPLISTLVPGSLVIKNDEGKTTYFVGGGFIDVSDNKVTVLAEEACKKEAIDVSDCKSQLTNIDIELSKVAGNADNTTAINLLKHKKEVLIAQIKVSEG